MSPSDQNIETPGESFRELDNPITVASDVVVDICLDTPEATHTETSIALAISRAVSVTPFDSGKSSTGVAAAALYIAGTITSNPRLTQRAIQRACGVTTVTIRNIYRELPQAALEYDNGALEDLTDTEREKLEYLADLSERGDRPGWEPHNPINERDFE